MDQLNVMRLKAEKKERSRALKKNPYHRELPNNGGGEGSQPSYVPILPSDVTLKTAVVLGYEIESAITEYKRSYRFQLRSKLEEEILVHHPLPTLPEKVYEAAKEDLPAKK